MLWLSCSKYPCRNSYSLCNQIQIYEMRKKGTKKISALHLDWPLIVHTETFFSRRLPKAARLLAALLVTFPVFFLHFHLVKCEWFHYIIFRPLLAPNFCLSLFWGFKAVFGLSAAAYSGCSEGEIIMWATSQFRLEGAKEWKQTESG